jgi:hypothetical protein
VQSQPPLWSLLVYMLLTETFNISDNTLSAKFGLSVSAGETSMPLSDLSILPRHGAQGFTGKHSETLKATCKADEGKHHSGRLIKVEIYFSSPSHDTDKSMKAPGGMTIQCFDGCPMALSPIDSETSQSQGGRKQRPFIHLDRYLGGGWSSVYASSKSRIIVKFAHVPEKDKAMLECLLRDEKAAYRKLAHLPPWIPVVPHFYGEYEWYGGRALVLSDEGPNLGMRMESLGFIERCDSLTLLGGEFC